MFTRLSFAATNFEVYIFEGSEHSHVLFLNTDQFTTNENITVSVIRVWDLKKGKSNTTWLLVFYLNDKGRYEAWLPFKESHELIRLL